MNNLTEMITQAIKDEIEHETALELDKASKNLAKKLPEIVLRVTNRIKFTFEHDPKVRINYIKISFSDLEAQLRKF